ncbi:MAG: tetratricopeptide repeat protein [Chloroflexota bacterium]
MNKRTIKQALKAWNSASALGMMPLAQLEVVIERQRVDCYPNTPMGLGMALRNVLRDAVEMLKPDTSTPVFTERRWRTYLLLTERLLHNRTPESIAAEMFISRQTYYNELDKAIKALSDLLLQWETKKQTALQPPHTEAQESFAGDADHRPSIFLAPTRSPYALSGRAALLASVKQRLLSRDGSRAYAIHGLPGVGKTALAIELAHDPQILDHFCDGVLWVGLGAHPDVFALLGSWAVALQVPDEVLARRTSLYDRILMLHTLIGLRRYLIVIDDVWQTDAALNFKIGGPNCSFLLTTRLANVAADFAGEDVFPVKELAAPDGQHLLAQVAPCVSKADPASVQEIVEAVGGLPLALILVGRHLRQQGDSFQPRRLQRALQRLKKAENRFNLSQPISPLNANAYLPADATVSLRAVIGLSDMALDTQAQKALRRLTLFPKKPNNFSEAAALAIIDAPEAVLDQLVDQGLLENVGPGRYTIHQTIADYAGLDAQEPAAIESFVSYWLGYVQAHAGDVASLSLDLSNIEAAANLASQYRLQQPLLRLTLCLQPFLAKVGLHRLAEETIRQALLLTSETDQVARYELLLAREAIYNKQGMRDAQLEDLDTLASLAAARQNLYWQAEVALRQSDYAEAISNFPAAITAAQRAVNLAQAIQNVAMEAAGYLSWGRALQQQSNSREAAPYLEKALALSRVAHWPGVEAESLRILGLTVYYLGDYARSQKYLGQALVINRRMDDRWAEGRTLKALGVLALDRQEYSLAKVYLEQTLSLVRMIGDRQAEAKTLNNLGSVAYAQRLNAEAIACFEQALEISLSIRDRLTEGRALGNLCEMVYYAGDYERASALADGVLQVSRQIGDRWVEGNGLRYRALVARRLGRFAEAIQLLERSCERYREINSSHYADVSLAWLALLYYEGGKYDASRAAVERLLHCDDHEVRGRALSALGHVFLDTGNPGEAAEAYEQAKGLKKALRKQSEMCESSSDLAWALAVQAKPAQAFEQVSSILGQWDQISFIVMDDPCRFFLACYRVLKECQPLQARTVLEEGHRWLVAQADRFQDAASRHSFLNDVPSQKSLREEWVAIQATKSP